MSPGRPPMVVAALAMFFASVTNAHAHVHLCLDGQEPPATIHGGHDVGHIHHGDEQRDHDDLDLDLPDEGIAKSFKPDLPAMAPQNVALVSISMRVVPIPISGEGNSRGPDPPYTRPQSRAPPSILL